MTSANEMAADRMVRAAWAKETPGAIRMRRMLLLARLAYGQDTTLSSILERLWEVKVNR